MIIPTVGRVVWFWPQGRDERRQPHVGLVTYVHSPHMVNLAVFSDLGAFSAEPSVPLHQTQDLIPAHRCCCWMPYQLGQAAEKDTRVPMQRLLFPFNPYPLTTDKDK